MYMIVHNNILLKFIGEIDFKMMIPFICIMSYAIFYAYMYFLNLMFFTQMSSEVQYNQIEIPEISDFQRKIKGVFWGNKTVKNVYHEESWYKGFQDRNNTENLCKKKQFICYLNDYQVPKILKGIQNIYCSNYFLALFTNQFSMPSQL